MVIINSFILELKYEKNSINVDFCIKKYNYQIILSYNIFRVSNFFGETKPYIASLSLKKDGID